ncbi:hypothetical protein BMJ27_07435 [Sinorhizobium medicae]|uniref:hypothetical protein n=1 Tax=Sinorhizobium medicae TaxID=110321 RepID=UPI000C7ACCEA|nr:hypothetical protein [Sinorhizobium medicae]PLU37986.1 hypothetical protein BMJ27_07435 [Sinorhizobium medicae]
MTQYNEATALYERLEDIVTTRICQIAQSHTEPDEQSVASLANHVVVRDAVKRFIDEHPGFFE